MQRAGPWIMSPSEPMVTSSVVCNVKETESSRTSSSLVKSHLTLKSFLSVLPNRYHQVTRQNDTPKNGDKTMQVIFFFKKI